MKFSLIKGKNKRTLVFTLISLFSILFILAGNFVLSYFMPSKSIYLDITKEGLYTLSDAMKEETAFVEELDKDIEIIFCNDEDKLISSMSTRLTYFMALQLQERYSNIKVKAINASLNPTAFAPYKPNSLSEIYPTDVIVSYGDRYRITSANRFWTFDGDEYFGYNGEYRIVSLMRSVSAVNQPKAYFLKDYGTTFYDPDNPESEMSQKLSAFKDLLVERGLEIKTLELSLSEGVPDDCALLIINNPTIDFKTDPSKYDSISYVSDTEKLDRYLVKNQGAIMFSKDYRQDLPVLEDFLHNWGIEFGDYLVKDELASLSDALGSNTQLIASYNKDDTTYSHALYGSYADISSAPRTVFKNAGYVKCSFEESNAAVEDGTSYTSRFYESFLTTSSGAKAYGKNSITGEYNALAGNAGVYDLAGLIIRERIDEIKNETTNSFIFCVNTKDFFENEHIGSTYYANYDIISTLVEDISNVNEYGSMDLGGLSANSSSYGGKQLQSTALSTEQSYVYSGDGKKILETNRGIDTAFIAVFATVVFLIPAGIAIAGVAVRIKRRYL
jgi:hypothetical protein